MSLQRGQYLAVHDALKRILGKHPHHLSAFVKHKQPFQCDMVVNSHRTDPDLGLPFLQRYLRGEVTVDEGGNPMEVTHYDEEVAMASGGGSAKGEDASLDAVDRYNTKLQLPISPHIKEFGRVLQDELGTCHVLPRLNRLDIVFQDRQVLQLALGAAHESIGSAHYDDGSFINFEPEAHRRPRLRISLGFDEELFKQRCDFKMRLAARQAEKWAYQHWCRSRALEWNTEAAEYLVAAGEDYRALLPPISFWLAHSYKVCEVLNMDNPFDMKSFIVANFFAYYGKEPFDNPFCPGEDLNTINTVRWLCECFVGNMRHEIVELDLSSPYSEEMMEMDKKEKK